jgi:hypothetical protein
VGRRPDVLHPSAARMRGESLQCIVEQEICYHVIITDYHPGRIARSTKVSVGSGRHRQLLQLQAAHSRRRLRRCRCHRSYGMHRRAHGRYHDCVRTRVSGVTSCSPPCLVRLGLLVGPSHDERQRWGGHVIPCRFEQSHIQHMDG